jgi:hypothetical protein
VNDRFLLAAQRHSHRKNFSLPAHPAKAVLVFQRRGSRPLLADTVEKLRISDVVIFRKEPVIGKSQVISAMRRSELPHERQKTNLAELLASKSWSRRTGKNFTDFAKNGVFQHNQPTSY